MRKVVLTLCLIVFILTQNILVQAQFNKIKSVIFEGAYSGNLAWGDYDNDGDLDLLMTVSNEYNDPSNEIIIKLYKNDRNEFSEVYKGHLKNISNGSAEWGDYDGDGDLDILLTGNGDTYSGNTIIYQNTGDGFIEVCINEIIGVSSGFANWGDYDNDGDLDVLVSGYNNRGNSVAKIYQNSNGKFKEVYKGNLIPVGNSSSEWGDYDNDGDLDILLIGHDENQKEVSKIYQNTGNGFIEVHQDELIGIASGACCWGDYDNDGDLDILLTGGRFNSTNSKIYENTGNGFTEVFPNILIGIGRGTSNWVDYDSDGDLDIYLTGVYGYDPRAGELQVSRIYKNTGSSFVFEDVGLPIPVYNEDAKWGDIDNDGDLDVAVIKKNRYDEYELEIYENLTSTKNTPPSVPTNLLSINIGNSTILKWGQSTDSETPQKGLLYNIYIYEDGVGKFNNAPQANTQTGQRLIADFGNIRWTNQGYKVNLPGCGKKYNWSVQAVDAGFKGSEFALESSFNVDFAIVPEPYTLEVGLKSFTTKWTEVPCANGYLIAVAKDPDFNDLVPEYAYKDINKVASYYVDGLEQNIIYYYRILAYNDFGLNTITNTVQVRTGLYTLNYSDTLPNLIYGTSIWKDYDNDGKLEILLDGNQDLDTTYHINIYKKLNDNFNKIKSLILKGFANNLTWGDYDSDSDLDFIVGGEILNEFQSGLLNYSRIFKNTNNNFDEVYKSQIEEIHRGSYSWSDFDNDGDLDLAILGSYYSEPVSKLYKNIGNGFEEVYKGEIDPVSDGAIAWGDFDNDGDADLLISGEEGAKLYENTENGFAEVPNVNLTGLSYGTTSFADYDNDGDLDILLTGYSVDGEISQIYQNTGYSFIKVYVGELPGISGSYVTWGDCDNDGDLDILLTGSTDEGRIFKIYQNTGNGFTELSWGSLPDMTFGSSDWADFDDDGDIDILLSGYDNDYYYCNIYKNNIEKANTKAVAPANLVSTIKGRNVTLVWDKTTDAETPQDGLSYNLFVYKLDSKTKSKKLYSKVEKIQYCTNGYTLKNFPNGQYSWTVQAYDTGLRGGELAPESFFEFITEKPEINVKGNDVNIPDGNSTISLLNHTDFGELNIGESVTRMYAIENLGLAELIIGTIKVNGTGFSVSQSLVSTLMYGENTTFTVTFTAQKAGSSIGNITISNNDADENIYNFAISGAGIQESILVTWTKPEDIVYGTLLDGNQLNATSDVEGVFIYSPAAGAKLNAGYNQKLDVEFTPADLSKYNIENKSVYINVLKADPLLEWGNPKDIPYGDLLDKSHLNALANIQGGFVYSPPEGTFLYPGKNQVLKADFIPEDAVNYNTASKTVLVNVVKMFSGIDDTEAGGLNIFPNPSSGLLSISNLKEFTNSKDLLISVMSIDGRILLQNKIADKKDTEIIDVSSIPDGFYILKVQANNKSALMRLIKK